MRFFNWKTAIVSLVIFVVPIFFYPVSGTMTNGVTTYSYGFPSNWLSVRFDTQGGRLFGFELFGANIVGTNVSILTALLDLLVGSITFLLNFQIGEKNVVVKKKGFLLFLPTFIKRNQK